MKKEKVIIHTVKKNNNFKKTLLVIFFGLRKGFSIKKKEIIENIIVKIIRKILS